MFNSFFFLKNLMMAWEVFFPWRCIILFAWAILHSIRDVVDPISIVMVRSWIYAISSYNGSLCAIYLNYKNHGGCHKNVDWVWNSIAHCNKPVHFIIEQGKYELFILSLNASIIFLCDSTLSLIIVPHKLHTENLLLCVMFQAFNLVAHYWLFTYK